MKVERIEEVQKETAYPDSVSVQQALLKVWNECEHENRVKNNIERFNLHTVMPRISHFVDENGNNVDLNAEGVNVRLNKDGTIEFFRSFGFAGRKELTPICVT